MAFTIEQKAAAVVAGTSASEVQGAVANLADGGWIVTWASNSGGDSDIFQTRYNSRGLAQNPKSQLVNAGIGSAATDLNADVTGLPGGGWVVVWRSDDDGDSDIFQRVFSSTGSLVSTIELNAENDTVDDSPRVTTLKGGGWVVTWQSNADGDNDIYQTHYSDKGVLVGTAGQKVNIENGVPDQRASVAALADGGWVVAWDSLRSGVTNIYTRRYKLDGKALDGVDVQVGEVDVFKSDAAVIGLSGGGYVVTWGETGAAKVRHLRYDSNGGPLDAAPVPDNEAAAFGEPSSTGLADGGWVTAWSTLADLISIRRYDAAGNPVTSEISSGNGGGSGGADLASIADGYVLGFNTTAAATGIDVHQRLYTFSLTGVSDVATGSGGPDALSFTPAALTSGDEIDGKGGVDTLVQSGAGTVDLRVPAVLTGIEAYAATAGNDTLVTSAARLPQFTSLSGGAGSDTLLLAGGGTFSFVGKTLSGFEAIRVDGAAPAVLSLAAGADKAFGGAGKDKMLGNAGNDTLSGAAGNDTLFGGVGNDILNGDLGKDALTGSKGKDIFVFDTKLSSANIDKVLDFNVKDNSFRLDNAVFKKLGKGTPAKPVKLSADAFFKGKAAEDKEDRILYDGKSGALSYDADGSGSAHAVKFAILKKGLTLTHADFFVI